MRKVKKLILHCSDSNIVKHNSIHVIRRWHKARGFSDVGYHYFILLNGDIQNGRPLDDDAILESNEIGAHVKGENLDSIGICLHGKDISGFTSSQFRSLAALIRKLAKQFDLEKGFICGHNDFNKAKSCPNFDVVNFIKLYLPELAKDGKGTGTITKGSAKGSKAGAAGTKTGSKGKP